MLRTARLLAAEVDRSQPSDKQDCTLRFSVAAGSLLSVLSKGVTTRTLVASALFDV